MISGNRVAVKTFVDTQRSFIALVGSLSWSAANIVIDAHIFIYCALIEHLGCNANPYLFLNAECISLPRNTFAAITRSAAKIMPGRMALRLKLCKKSGIKRQPLLKYTLR